MHADRLGRDALADDFLARLFAEPSADSRDGLQHRIAERLLDRLLPRRADVGKAHAVGRKQRRERMDQHPGHAERIGDQAGVLAARAAEAVEHIARHVVAALHRDLLDRVRHVLDRDLDEAVGNLFGAAPVANLACEPGETRAHRIGVERLVLVRSENLREEIPDQLADHHIGVGERERPAPPITGRARIGGRRSRGRRESAPRRNAGSSRRRPPPCGSASSARACARPRLRFRTRARIRRRNATHRSRCRPCRSR